MQTLDGRYRLEELRGTGGMAEVWRAYDEVLGRDVAVKLLTPALAGSQEARDRSYAEARAAAGLAHPNITSVFDFGLSVRFGEPAPYIVMELLDGETLTQRLAGGALPWRRALGICADIAAALASAHASGVIHRDVKPANVMITSRGVKVLDFGIAGVVGAVDDDDQPFLGTVAYLAPERLLGRPAVPATDVYALGLVIYRCLTGDFPWPGRSHDDMIANHCLHAPDPLPPIDRLPAHIPELVDRCLSKNPVLRPDAVEVARVLGGAARVRVVLPGDDPVPAAETDSWPLVRPEGNADGPGPGQPATRPGNEANEAVPQAATPGQALPDQAVDNSEPGPDGHADPASTSPTTPSLPTPPTTPRSGPSGPGGPGSRRPGSGPAPGSDATPPRRRLPRLAGAVLAGVGVAMLIILAISWGFPVTMPTPGPAEAAVDHPPPPGKTSTGPDGAGPGPTGPGPTGGPGTDPSGPAVPGAGGNPSGTVPGGGGEIDETVLTGTTGPVVTATTTIPATTHANVVGYACKVGYKSNAKGTNIKVVVRNTGTATFTDWQVVVTLSNDGAQSGPTTRTLTLSGTGPLTPKSKAAFKTSDPSLVGFAMVRAVVSGIPCGSDPPPADAE